METLENEELDFAQNHLRILSGLYGILKPLDAIQPYRLEMGSKLNTNKGKSLYQYWGDMLSLKLNEHAKDVNTDILINCASQEYFGAIKQEALNLKVITPVFLESKAEGPKIISFFAKRARGAMARFIIQNRITTPKHLSDFDKNNGLIDQKYSLVYYLSVGDQNCSEPGILKLYEPREDILPCEGMITIIPASRMHSAVYGGKTDRVMIGVNFYTL